jgi:hypothetical protein
MKRIISLLLVGESSAAYRNTAYFEYALERPDSIRLGFTSPGYYARFGGLGRLLNMVDLVFKVLGCDRVLILPMCQTQPYVNLVVRIAKVLRKPVWLDIYLSFYETQVLDRKVYAVSSREAILLYEHERRLFSECERLVFLNQAECEYYGRILNLSFKSEQIAHIPLIAPCRPQARLPQLRGDGLITFAWWGRLGNPLHGLEIMLEAFAGLEVKNFRILLAVDGSAELIDNLRQYIQKLFLQDIVELRPDFSFSNGKLLNFLVEEADVALGVFGSSGKARTVNVNKVVDALSLGMPCITVKSAALALLPNTDSFIHLWDGASVSSLTSLIKSGLNDKNIWLSLVENTESAFKSNFSSRTFVSSMDRLISEIVCD